MVSRQAENEFLVSLLKVSLEHYMRHEIPVSKIRIGLRYREAILSESRPGTADFRGELLETFWGYPVEVDTAISDDVGAVIEHDRDNSPKIPLSTALVHRVPGQIRDGETDWVDVDRMPWS
jgi:hypothetical protein